MIVVNERITIPREEFTVDFARSGGPGGQNVNKVASKALVRWRPGESRALPADVRERLMAAVASRLSAEGELLVTSQRTRDQSRNLEDCFAKIRALVAKALIAPKSRRATRPTEASRRERLQAKKHRAARKVLRQPPGVD